MKTDAQDAFHLARLLKRPLRCPLAEHLAGTPFPSFLVPGLVLGVIVGGTQLVAAVAIPTRRHWALLMAAVAGFGMLIWIFIELAIVGYSWLQSVYFGLGVLELILVLALLGVAPALVSSWDPQSSRPVTCGDSSVANIPRMTTTLA